jgi:hypothetical protein
MIFMTKLAKFTLSLLFIVCFSLKLFSQGNIVLSGRVYSSVTKKAVDFATVAVLEERAKGRTDSKGFYTINISKPGTYTIYVTSTGLKTLKKTVEITGTITMDFTLFPARVRGATLTIRDERDVQKVSRRTLTVEDLKEVPASLGDSINALTSLPGVDRTNGFFGPLVIRGADPVRNGYYIDGMPIFEPMHFGGLHSVVANELMSEIDLFSSAFPAKYGGPLAAIIEINTVDTVKEFGGIFDIGIISATGLIRMPITRTVTLDEELKEQNAGYMIVSGRYGYLWLLVPYIYELITDEKLEWLPDYYDYQFKGKYYINSKHSLTLLVLGSADYWKLLLDDAADFDPEKGDDPLLQDINFKIDSKFHNFGGYYNIDYGKFKNRVMIYAALLKQYSYVDGGANSSPWFQDLYMDSKPYIYGVKNSFKLKWWGEFAELRGDLFYTYYAFTAKGKSLVQLSGETGFDLSNDDLFTTIPVDLKSTNHSAGGYLENKFTSGGLTFVPGVRTDYFKRSDEYTVDPRGMISYEFKSETTISFAGGRYSSFFQTNPYFFTNNPQYSTYGSELEPERAVHSVFGIEQIYDLFTFNVEAFYNYYYDLAVAYGHDVPGEGFEEGQNSGELKSYGFEVLIRKDRRGKGLYDFFGWLSYTYNQSKYKSGITGNVWEDVAGTWVETTEKFDPNGDKWINNDFERRHTVKLVAGYKWEKFTISSRFQLYTSFPYTPISGNEPPETLDTGNRYAPIYSDDANSKHFPVDHRLDIRFSWQHNKSWGHIKWYIEFINIYGLWYKAKDQQHWYYNKPYGSDNPKIEEEEGGLSFIPNFGVEIKF